jgi:hypothetical protein
MRSSRFAILLLAAVAAGCSDDSIAKLDLRRDISSTVDKSPVTEGTVNKDGTKKDSTKDQTATKQFSGQLIVAQSSGRTTYGPPPSVDAGASIYATIFAAEAYFLSSTNANDKPDFIDSPAPPNCVAYHWTATSPIKRETGDAGKITIANLKSVQYLDGDNLGAGPKTLPTSIDCTRKQVGGLWFYDCGLPNSMILLAPAIDDSSALDFTIAGGTDVAAFSEKAVATGPVVKPKSSFDMNQLPLTNIKAEWETTTAALVAIDIIANLKDNSEFGRISCSALGMLGSKDIPAAALAVLPKPTATNPLILRSALIGFNVKGSKAAWGDYTIGVGRGAFGVSCWTPAGNCP